MKHIVILRQPFFNMVLNGEKTIESKCFFALKNLLKIRK